MSNAVHLIALATAGPAAIGAVMGTVIAADKYRRRAAARRPVTLDNVSTRAIGVADKRTLEMTLAQAERLAEASTLAIAADDLAAADRYRNAAIAALMSAKVWLKSERHYGRPRRRVRIAAALERVEARLEQLAPTGWGVTA